MSDMRINWKIIGRANLRTLQGPAHQRSSFMVGRGEIIERDKGRQVFWKCSTVFTLALQARVSPVSMMGEGGPG